MNYFNERLSRQTCLVAKDTISNTPSLVKAFEEVIEACKIMPNGFVDPTESCLARNYKKLKSIIEDRKPGGLTEQPVDTSTKGAN